LPQGSYILTHARMYFVVFEEDFGSDTLEFVQPLPHGKPGCS